MLITTSRAEFGLFYWLIKALENDADIDFSLVVTGSHLCLEHGYTVNEIEAEGFEIAEKVSIFENSDSSEEKSKASGLASILFADVYKKLSPDLVIMMGDRFELLGIASAAVIQRIPIAHFSGGEITEGVLDDIVRHAVTKMSAIHFVSNVEHQTRVIQLGEQPSTVFNVGEPGLEHIHHTEHMSLDEISTSLNFPLANPFFLFTFHPVLDDGGMGPEQQVNEVLMALDAFPNHQILMTHPNADAQSNKILSVLTEYEKNHPNRVKLVPSLGFRRYLSALKSAKLVIGNSSSGLIEAPSYGVKTINIGIRQKGRLQGNTVINADVKKSDIICAIQTGLAMDSDVNSEPSVDSEQGENPYGDGYTVDKVIKTIKSLSFPLNVNKPFFDIKASNE